VHRIYLDHNGTAPLLPEARAAYRRAIDDPPGNPSSVHAFGHRARMTVEAARDQVAALVGAAPREVVFTASATEANNLALLGAIQAAATGRRRVVGSAFEHPSVGRVLDHLEGHGFEVVRVRPDREGRVSAADIVAAADPVRTALVSLMLANHEIGTLQPVDEVARALAGSGVVIHADAAQAAGRMPVRFADLGIDLMTIAAHKFGGPVGAGALVVRSGSTIAALLHGGGQELNRRPGTENVPALAAFGAAAAAAAAGLDDEGRRQEALRDRLESAATRLGHGIRVNGAGAPRLPNTTSLFVPGADAETMVIGLDLEGCAVSAGAACSAGAIRRSPALVAMGLEREAAASIRISLGATTTADEIDRFVVAMGAVVARALAHAPAAGVAR
jgi:cysteine desulfurase